jgi:hypothetical protein
LTRGFPNQWVSSPNTFPNTLQTILQYDNARPRGGMGRSKRSPLTPDVLPPAHLHSS